MRSLIRAFASRLNVLWVLSYCPNNIWSFSAWNKASHACLSLHISKCKHCWKSHVSVHFFSSIFCLSGPMLTVRLYFILSSWHNRILVLLMLNSLPPIVLCCQIAFAKGLNPDQVRKNVWPDLDAIYLTQMIFEKEFFFLKKQCRVPTEIQKHNSMIFPWFSMINNVISMTF